jgi:hypothetical protein
VPVGIVLIGIIVGLFALWLGPIISKLSTPQAQAIVKNIIATFQYLALSLTLRLRWPPALVRSRYGYRGTLALVLTSALPFSSPSSASCASW